MCRNRRKLTQPNIKKLIKEGRGQGERESYSPWITIHDLSSKGFKHRVRGNTVDRTHHLLSNNEWFYFLLLEFSPTVVDIREQYPLLPIEETIEIARDMRVQHPRDPKTKELFVMTTDFLATTCAGGYETHIPRTLKPGKDLQKKTVVIKLEIERRYWLRREKELGIVTDTQLPQTLCKNLEMLHGYVRPESLGDLPAGCVDKVRDYFNASLIDGNQSVVEVTVSCDEVFGLPTGGSLAVFWHLLSSREWSVDLSKPLDSDKPLSELITGR